MIQINYIRENLEEIIELLKIKKFDARIPLEKALKLDESRRAHQKKLDDTLAEANKLSKQIGELFKAGKKEEANSIKEQTTQLKEDSKEFGRLRDQYQNDLNTLLTTVPNVPHQSVPQGNSEDDNELIQREGEIPMLIEHAKPHWELAQEFDIIDFQLGVKITGAGFPVYKNKGAKLQRALISFFLDEAEKAGYSEVQPPLMVNEDSGYGTGQLPDKDGQMYKMEADNLYMIPTAEVPVTNIYRDLIVNRKDLPLKNVAYSPCFRREAGSYGKDVRGLNRLHQFDKVEIVQIAHPDKSYQLLDEMISHVANLLRKLNLPFRIVKLCGGDLSFTAALTYDFEVYSAAQKKWLEVSSISNFESYQSNRLKLRFRNEEGKTELAHTLNGSALALPRVLAALLENNQTKNSVLIPEALIPYTKFDRID